ncbi:MAG: HDOD domain-containing protein [Methylicorpusculum sp.]|uniref:HDOD domain-containing protein n=1 Tax=Methylicorpusculum sp. TaxID=2713644 RepID=UPI0027203678|nr:HDOD domain-containing protein [Methylicorpusculum sp.]MDO8939876.1 HDOD domain-containing protein [Methylicorpusculum sp.]MDP2202485.1 HDOD domain-containing protein [Methylicorpusculum sp.]
MSNDNPIEVDKTTESSTRTNSLARSILKKPVKDLQLIPAAALKLLKLTNDDTSKVKDLSRVIETEPALAAKVIRIVNSAAFCLPKKITSIKHAVNLLGFSAVRQAAMDQLMYNKLIRNRTKSLFNQLFFWQHCLFVASLSKRIGVALKYPDPDMLYTGGLLHDIGKIIVENYGEVSYSDYLSVVEKTDCAQMESEKTFFGLSHTEIGHHFCLEWHLPSALTAIIAFHHDFPPPSSEYHQYQTEIAIVAFSNYIACMQGIGSAANLSVPVLPEQVFKIIDINKLDLESLLEQVDKDMLNTREFYGIQFPNASRLRASLVKTTLKLSYFGESKTRIKPKGADLMAPNISSLTIPHRSLDPNEFIPWTLEAIHNDFHVDRVMMLKVDPKRRGLVATYWWPSSILQKDLGIFEIPISAISGQLLKCLRTKKPVLIKNESVEDEKMLHRLAVDECIVLPVQRHQRMAGLIYVDNALTHQPLEAHQIFEMLPIASELGVALLNAQLYRLAQKKSQIDPLSQLFNKRVINEFLDKLFKCDKAVLEKTVLGFIDIDRFKLFNDDCGHQAGDDALKIVADILRSMTRPGDLIGRYGGEEFLFVLRDIDSKGALNYAERIRREIEQRGKLLSERFRGHALTVSIGVAVYEASFATYADMIKAADDAMYRAKSEGRNKVVLSNLKFH